MNDPSHPLTQGQFSEILANKFKDGSQCTGQSGWYGEQSLDVVAVHATAPGANILFDDVLQMAAGTGGVSVMFSSGDEGDNGVFGTAVPNYPASSPWATAVGGTSLEIGASDQRIAEYGWSTGKVLFCNSELEAVGGCKKKQIGTWLPLGYDYGGGGGTSDSYIEPYCQEGVVPTSMSEMRGSTAMRVLPDISIDADPTTAR
jgi:subtilase family serine protease